MRKHILLGLIVIVLSACQSAVRETATVPSTKQPTPSHTVTPTPSITATASITPTPSITLTPSITPTISPISSYSELVWDPNSKWLAYTNSQGEVCLQNRDGKLTCVTLHEPDVNLATPRWSPNGDGILIAWQNLWLIPVTSAGLGQPKLIQSQGESVPSGDGVTFKKPMVYFAAWSPNGKQIAFVYNDEGWLYENGRIRQLTDINAIPTLSPVGLGLGNLIWSPDGSQLYFESYDRQYNPSEGVMGAIRIDIATGKQTVMAGRGLMSGFSPDGKMFLSPRGTYSNYYLLDSEFHEKVNLTNMEPVCDKRSKPACDPPIYLGLYNLSWGPNGQYLYQTIRLSPSEGTFTGFMVRASPEKIIADHRGDAKNWYANPVWLKDGRYAYLEIDPIIYLNDGGDSIYAVHNLWIGETVVPTKPLEVVQHSGAFFVAFVAWSPDGSALAAIVLDRPLSDLTIEDEYHRIFDNVGVHLEIIPLEASAK